MKLDWLYVLNIIHTLILPSTESQVVSTDVLYALKHPTVIADIYNMQYKDINTGLTNINMHSTELDY